MKYRTQKSKQGLFFDYCFDKNRLKKWISKIYDETIATDDITIVPFIENLKTFGFNEATKAGISIGIDDLKIPPQKRQLLQIVEAETQEANARVQNETITPLENFQLTIDLWHKTNEIIKGEVVTNFECSDTLNPVYMMAFSGARGNLSQVTQLLGMRGFMSDPEGQIIDFPIRSNFREGLTLTEYIISCYGARKGLVDTALRTADAGYLTRRLVDVAHSLVITIPDCKPKHSTWLTAIKENNKVIYPLETRLIGRVLADDVFINYLEPKTGSLIKEPWPYFKKYKQINQLDAKLLGSCFRFVNVRSPLSCSHIYALCQLCYGWTLPHSHLAPLGEAVGIIAAQSIGEPGTQLTMRTFHTGGVFSGVLSDEILAPYAGTIYYSRPIIGAMFRLANGKLGFLIREIADIIILPEEEKQPINSIFKMKLPENSILFLKHKEKVKRNQLLLELPKEKDDDNETLLNEYTYYSKTSGLVKLEDASVYPEANYYPTKLYKRRRFRRRPRNLLRETSIELGKEEAKYLRKKKVIYVYYPMQEQNQKYNSVKIYQGEICYASTVQTLPKRGDLINRNSLIAITELTNFVNSELKRTKQTKIFAENKILKNNNQKIPKLKLEKTIFNLNIKTMGFKVSCGYTTLNYQPNPISIMIQTLKSQPKKSIVKINLVANNFLIKTNGKLFWAKKPLIDGNLNIPNLNPGAKPNYKLISNSMYWLNEPIIRDHSKLNFVKARRSKILKKKQKSKKVTNLLLSTQLHIRYQDKTLKTTSVQRNTLEWVKKGKIFSFQKTNQGFVQTNQIKSDGLVKWQCKKINFKKTRKRLKRDPHYLLLKKVKAGWPYLGLNFFLQDTLKSTVNVVGEKLLHDIYSDQHNFVCEYYSTKLIRLHSNKNYLKKLNNKQNIFSRDLEITNQFLQKLHTQNLYLVLIRKTSELNFSTLTEQIKKFQPYWIQNKSFILLKKYQYLTNKNFLKAKTSFFIQLFNQINRQINLLSKVLQVENSIFRFEQNIFAITPAILNSNTQFTSHQLITQQNSISPRVLGYLTITVRPNPFLLNTQEFFQTANIFNQTYQCGLFEFINEDPFFIKQLHGPNNIYCSVKNLFIPQNLPLIKNFFLSNHNGEVFNTSKFKYTDSSHELHVRERLKLKSSPGSTVLTSSNSFTININNPYRQLMLGQEIYRGLNLGNQTTSLTNGEIIYLTKTQIKCQRIDKFIMSTNSKFFCQANQFILKNTRLYTDFYPRLQMGDIVQGIPKIEEFFEARRSKKGLAFDGNLHNRLKERFEFYCTLYPLPIADLRSINDIQTYIIGSIFKLYSSQGINISDKHLELIVRQMTTKVHVTEYYHRAIQPEYAVLGLQPIIREYYPRYVIEDVYWNLFKERRPSDMPSFRYVFKYEPVIFGITQASLDSSGFISAASFQETTRILTQSTILQKIDYLNGLKENVVLGHLIPAGTALQTRLKHGPRQVRFKRTEFKTKLSKLLINRCVLETRFDYNLSANSSHYSYQKAHKFINPVLYLFLYIYCVYYSQPRLL